MHGQYDADFHGAIIPGGSSVPVAGQIGPQKFSHAADAGLWFALMCRALWTVKAPAALNDLLGDRGDENRTYRRWTSGHSEPPQSILWQLLRTDEGRRVLEFIMQDDAPAWWKENERLQNIGLK